LSEFKKKYETNFVIIFMKQVSKHNLFILFLNKNNDKIFCHHKIVVVSQMHDYTCVYHNMHS